MKNLAAAVLAGLAIALAMPASALADAVATTDPATNVTFTSAQLNGTATTAAGGSYFFEWGTPSTSCKGRPPTPTSSFGSGIQHLSATITNLTPGVTYCFHLVVLPTYEEGRHVGQDQVFTTPLPGAVATTGDATSITDTAARLNGASNTVSLNSQWAFQYGTTTSYGATTQSNAIGAGVTVVSAPLAGLSPGTRYHFRLVVGQGSNPTTYSYGADHSFTTEKFGRLLLRKHRLKVSHRKVSIPLRCKGSPGGVCRGTVRITVHGKRCAGGQFFLRAGKRKTLKKTVRGRCLKLLGGANQHRLRARFRANVAGPQARLRRSIHLFD